jgi:hypothetical protein
MKYDEVFRLCVFLDVSAYTRRPIRDQLRVQGWLKDVMTRAITMASLQSKHNVVQEQGDGCLLLLDPHANLAAATHALITSFTEATAWVNEPLGETYRFSIRVAFDAGVVRRGDAGYAGRAITSVARLVNSEALRTAVAAGDTGTVGFMCSDSLYRDVIEDDTRHSTVPSFVQVVVEEKDFMAWAWLLGPSKGREPAPDERERPVSGSPEPR